MSITYFISLYIWIYQYSLYIALFFVWLCMSYIDRIHFRERCRKKGTKIHDFLTSYSHINKFYPHIRIYLLRPVCSLFEMIVGFLEGVENLEAIVNICENKDNFNECMMNKLIITPVNTASNTPVDLSPRINSAIIDDQINKEEIEIIDNLDETRLELSNECEDDVENDVESDIENDVESENEYASKRKVPIQLARRRHQY